MNTDIFSNQVGVNRLFVLVYSNQGNVKGLYFRMSVGLWLYQNHNLFSMWNGWGFATEFLNSQTLSNGGKGATLRQKKNFCFGHNIIAVIV